jgi:hypothetical protein
MNLKKRTLIVQQRLDKFSEEAPSRWKYSVWTGDVECLFT